MHWFIYLAISASAVMAQFPLQTSTRPTIFPLERPTRSGEVHVWGWNGGITPPEGLTNVVQITSGNGCEVALKTDGTLLAWGNTDKGRINLPPGLSSIVQVNMNSGGIHGLALRENGEVVAWGDDEWGRATVPADLAPVVQVAAGGVFSAVLLADGTVRVWGFGSTGSLAPPPNLTDVVSIASGRLHMLALKADGSVVAWGHSDAAQAIAVPSGLQNVVKIAAGTWQSLALKSDGTIVQWPAAWPPTPNLSGVVSIAAGTSQSLALASNGTLTSWGGSYGNNAPSGLANVFQLSCGNEHNVVLYGLPSAPALVIEKQPSTTITNNATSAPFLATLVGATSLNRVYTLRNNGNAALTVLTVAKSGANSSDFKVSSLSTNTLPAGTDTNFSVSFAPSTSGQKTAQLTITSNDSPFIINLSGFGLAEDTDTDSDGLNDAAEFAMSDLGFNWEVAQAELVNVLYTNANRAKLYSDAQFTANYSNGIAAGTALVLSNPSGYNLYTSSSIMDLRMGGLMIQKQSSNATVSFQLQTTTDLATLPFANNGAPVVKEIPMPEQKGFLRIQVKPE